MKKIVSYLVLFLLITSCNSEDAGDCFQTAGNIIQEEISLDDFDKILINERVSLLIKEGPIQKVFIETGKNLLPDVTLEVIDGQLIASDNNKCNFVRDYGLTKVIVTSPNITEIRNSSEQTVTSDGVLNYPNLRLLSEDYQSDYLNVGDFNLEVNTTSISITSNGISNFYLSGITTNLNAFFAAGDSRLEAQTLIATNVKFTNKSSNDMLVNPQDKIEGAIFSLGDVIAYYEPPIVDVVEHYKGKLIFN
ncbi:head GIN domain-containing protein [Urechidicola vernalis]|uniref:Head GIN domain-containing protein n=1 Tax=Urechidicola vernalis TaxID=3075600 RepID=A0ABU2Y5M8_9FLAO|nr:head GIN domain-containing protein [Urechidicola sp. P050]MDT0553509.1 head GIN domain-containing protein [Urechidicola sp. P050]